MNLVFYILIYLTVNCWNPYVIINEPMGSANQTYRDQSISGFRLECDKPSQVDMKIVDNIDDILEYKNKTLNSKGWYVFQKEPNHIYKVTVQDGKFSQKEVRIVPVIKKTKVTIEQERETIEGYRVE